MYFQTKNTHGKISVSGNAHPQGFSQHEVLNDNVFEPYLIKHEKASYSTKMLIVFRSHFWMYSGAP